MAGQIRVDEITNAAGTGSPSFPNGINATELTGDIVAARITDALNASGSAPVYACRAWVNFNGTTSGTDPAPMSIRASGNVSSVTRNSTGNYTVNFTTAMPDASYAISMSISTAQFQTSTSIVTSSSFEFRVRNDSGSATNAATCTAAIFR